MEKTPANGGSKLVDRTPANGKSKLVEKTVRHAHCDAPAYGEGNRNTTGWRSKQFDSAHRIAPSNGDGD